MKKLIILFSLLIFLNNSFAQDFGEISESNLNMTILEEDPEANAVYILNNGEIIITPDFKLKMKIHKRIKILTEKGKDLADVKLIYWHKDEIEDLEAVCYKPNGDEIELDDNNIFEEETKQLKTKSFAIPGVEVGSIIEYTYTMYSEYIANLEPWFFQNNHFTKLSKLIVTIPSGFTFNAFLQNTDNYNFQENTEEINNPLNPRKKALKCTWIATNLPGIKKEPYMTALNDYYCQVLFQLGSYNDGTFSYDFIKKWSDVSNRYYKLYDKYIEDNSLEEFTKTLVKGIEKKDDQINKIYTFILDNIKLNDDYSLGSKKLNRPDKIIELKEGSLTERNLLFVNMVKQLKINAYPIIISKKSNGKINPNWVNTDQFNRLIAYVTYEGKKRFVNTIDKYCPLGVLTPNYSVHQGLIVLKEKGNLIKIKPKSLFNRENILTELEITEDGNLIGKSEIKFGGIEGINIRENLEKNQEEFFKEYLKDNELVSELDSFKVENIEVLDKPVKVFLYYHINEYLDLEEETHYLTLPELHKLNENIFIRDNRTFPVDYPYTYSNSENIKLKFPNSLKIVECPKSITKGINKITFTKNYRQKNNEINLRRTFKVGRNTVYPGEYPRLKKLYSIVVDKDQEQIVLTKSQDGKN